MEYWNKRSQKNIALKSFDLLPSWTCQFHVVFAKQFSIFQTLKGEYLFDIVIWVKPFACSFCPKQFIRFLLHFSIRVSYKYCKISVTLKNQCIWSIFRSNSKQCKIEVSAIRGSVFGGFAVQISGIGSYRNWVGK